MHRFLQISDGGPGWFLHKNPPRPPAIRPFSLTFSYRLHLQPFVHRLLGSPHDRHECRPPGKTLGRPSGGASVGHETTRAPGALLGMKNGTEQEATNVTKGINYYKDAMSSSFSFLSRWSFSLVSASWDGRWRCSHARTLPPSKWLDASLHQWPCVQLSVQGTGCFFCGFGSGGRPSKGRGA